MDGCHFDLSQLSGLFLDKRGIPELLPMKVTAVGLEPRKLSYTFSLRHFGWFVDTSMFEIYICTMI